MAISTRCSGRSSASIAGCGDFRAGEPDEIGHVIHRPGGKAGGIWAFHYDIRDADNDPDDDEAGYRFGAHAFVPGEYVSIRDEDGELHTFLVVSVDVVA